MSGAQIAIVGLGIAAYALMRSRNTTSTKQDAEAEAGVQEKHKGHHRHHRKHEPEMMEGNNHDPGPTQEEKDKVRHHNEENREYVRKMCFERREQFKRDMHRWTDDKKKFEKARADLIELEPMCNFLDGWQRGGHQ